MLVYGEAEEQFRLLFEAAPNGMICGDRPGRYPNEQSANNGSKIGVIFWTRAC